MGRLTFATSPSSPGFQVEDTQRSILVLGLRNDVATVGRRRERVAAPHAVDAGQAHQELGVLQVGDVVNVVTTRAATVEAVLLAVGMCTGSGFLDKSAA